jgi:hypothetical protein
MGGLFKRLGGWGGGCGGTSIGKKRSGVALSREIGRELAVLTLVSFEDFTHDFAEELLRFGSQK